MKTFKFPPVLQEYADYVEKGPYRSCKEQKQLIRYVKKCFATEEIYINEEQLGKYLSLVKYFPFEKLFPWEVFILTLHACTYHRQDDRPRWPTLFCLIGRGAGKDGFIAFLSKCLASQYNGIPFYNVDICANNETQAMQPVRDLIAVLEQPWNIKKLTKFFYWKKQMVTSIKTKAEIRGWTNAPKGKDGLRSGIVIFNEVHQYENNDNIDVFTTGLGKKPHPRKSFFSTQGKVRDGPLDEILEDSLRILAGDEPDNGMLPFICRLDDKNEVHDELNWPKANPSLPYLPDLWDQIRREYNDWEKNPARLPAFMTKRMNLPSTATEYAAAPYELIQATDKPIPDLKGKSCVVGIDYASLQDWAAVDIHFRIGNMRYDINHAWLCTQSPTLKRIKPDWRQWERCGLLTVTDEAEIAPELIVDYIEDAARLYNIRMIALDNHRYALLRDTLEKAGIIAPRPKTAGGRGVIPAGRRQLKLIRPSDIMQVVPVIDSCFTNGYLAWGDNPMLRWATNNTKKLPRGRSEGTDTGNFYYAKIEAKSRKTDPFMAFVAAMAVEDVLGRGAAVLPPKIPTVTF